MVLIEDIFQIYFCKAFYQYFVPDFLFSVIVLYLSYQFYIYILVLVWSPTKK